MVPRSPTPRAALVLFNISKVRNLGQLIRTADALGAGELAVVGRREYRTHGAFGTGRGLTTRHFYTPEDAATDLRKRGYRLAAVEIVADARPVHEQPFSGPTAFLVGNEGQGLGTRELELCDEAVYVPQYGSGRSLNVNVAASIVLHHFALWAGLHENARDGDGFAPAERDQTSAK